MLQIKELTITYKKDLRKLISGLSFVLNPGDKAAIIGEEGNGKSTLIKLLYDEKLVEDYVEYSGEILRNNSVIGYLQQELEQSDKEMTIYESMTQEAGFYEAEGKELSGMANRMGIPPDLLYSCQKVDTLSGGEKVKLQMIRILCKRPDILLLDEPSNDIDLETLEWKELFCSFPMMKPCWRGRRTGSSIWSCSRKRKKQNIPSVILDMGNTSAPDSNNWQNRNSWQKMRGVNTRHSRTGFAVSSKK